MFEVLYYVVIWHNLTTEYTDELIPIQYKWYTKDSFTKASSFNFQSLTD